MRLGGTFIPTSPSPAAHDKSGHLPTERYGPVAVRKGPVLSVLLYFTIGLDHVLTSALPRIGTTPGDATYYCPFWSNRRRRVEFLSSDNC